MNPSNTNSQCHLLAQQGNPTQSAKLYQNPQQHQKSYSGSKANNNLNELDQGWFKIYKIALIIAFVWRIYNVVSIVNFQLTRGSLAIADLIVLIQEFASMALILMQFIAMKKRNLHKASIALIGFLGYFFSCLAYQTILFLKFWGEIEMELGFIAETFFFLSVDIALTVIGSFKVYQFLNVNQIKSETNHYHNYYHQV